jgi:acetylornithine/succinyldiaminopimelate/putrescine aminotransferase
MRAINVKHDLGSTIVQRALEHGLLLNSTSPTTLRMVPPLILTKGDLDEAAELLDRALADVAAMPIANA